MAMDKSLYARDDVDSLYVSRNKGGRYRASIQEGVNASMQQLED